MLKSRAHMRVFMRIGYSVEKHCRKTMKTFTLNYNIDITRLTFHTLFNPRRAVTWLVLSTLNNDVT